MKTYIRECSSGVMITQRDGVGTDCAIIPCYLDDAAKRIIIQAIMENCTAGEVELLPPLELKAVTK